MKRKWLVFALALAAIMMVGLLSGCGNNNPSADSPAVAPAENAGSGGSSDELPPLDLSKVKGAELQSFIVPSEIPINPNKGVNPKKTEYNFVYIPCLVNAYYDEVGKGVVAAVEEYASKGITINMSWDPPTQVDPAVSAQKLQNAAATNPDCIIIECSDNAVLNPIIKEVRDAGINVLTFIQDSTENDRQGFVGIDRFDTMGYANGKIVAEALGGQGEVAMLIGAANSPGHQDRVTGYKQAFAEYPGITIVCEYADNDDIETGINLTEKILSSYPNVRAITSADGNGAGAIAKAVTDFGKAGQIAIVGYDTVPEEIFFMREGAVLATFCNDAPGIGYHVTKMAIDVADGVQTGIVREECDYYILTRDNMADYGF